MKNKQIDELILPAIKLIEERSIEIEKNYMVPKEYESALSSFGGTIIQSGPIPACALYLKTSESKIDKSKLIFILMKLMKQQGGFFSSEILPPSNDKTIRKKWMEQLIKEYEKDNSLFKQRIMNATIALKLALRTFNLEKEQS